MVQEMDKIEGLARAAVAEEDNCLRLVSGLERFVCGYASAVEVRRQALVFSLTGIRRFNCRIEINSRVKR
jgi:hypothetical protein